MYEGRYSIDDKLGDLGLNESILSAREIEALAKQRILTVGQFLSFAAGSPTAAVALLRDQRTVFATLYNGLGPDAKDFKDAFAQRPIQRTYGALPPDGAPGQVGDVVPLPKDKPGQSTGGFGKG